MRRTASGPCAQNSSRPTFSMPDVRARASAASALGRVEVGHVERDDERVLRARDHASTSVAGPRRTPAGTRSRPRTSAGEASRFSFR